FVNPQANGACAVDPSNVVGETNENNNSCSNSVTVTAPDLTATKTNNLLNGTILLGSGNWTWTIAVANSGNASANFASGQTILTETVAGGAIYGAPSVLSPVGVSGTVNCSITVNLLTCTASGAVSIAAPGSFSVAFTATPGTAGSFINPTGGTCSVDP